MPSHAGSSPSEQLARLAPIGILTVRQTEFYEVELGREDDDLGTLRMGFWIRIFNNKTARLLVESWSRDFEKAVEKAYKRALQRGLIDVHGM